MMLNYFDMVQVDIAAISKAMERMPPGPARVADYMNDDDLRHGLREVFGECDDFKDELIEPLLELYKQTQAADEELKGIADAFVSRMYGR